MGGLSIHFNVRAVTLAALCVRGVVSQLQPLGEEGTFMTVGSNSFTSCVLKVWLAPVSVLRPPLLLPSETERHRGTGPWQKRLVQNFSIRLPS